MCQLTERLINKGMKQGLEQGRKEMQTKVEDMQLKMDAAEARAKKAEEEADDANSKLAKLKAYLNTMGINPDAVMEEQASYGKQVLLFLVVVHYFGFIVLMYVAL